MSSGEAGPQTGKTTPPGAAHYIADLTAGMAALAERADLRVVAYPLNLARVEAEQILLEGDFRPD